ncbi:PREDICTED: WAP four-disulfide core domain protein 5-like, partial [Wasmannia auropunctata]
EPSIEPECIQDSDCPLNLACINNKCQDPCVSAGMCTSEQECRVLNTEPLRTMICLCPPNTITDINGQCKQIVLVDVQCHLDQDCANHETCLDGKCVDACLTTQCGFNAQCKSTSHTGICFCSQDFTGNAYIECIR